MSATNVSITELHTFDIETVNNKYAQEKDISLRLDRQDKPNQSRYF